ncbi:hypothetical protein SAMN05660971_03193 [Halomonas cupida]|uniref:Uncharacterized protein n=1 Tax=Halomonas cupida TaxID=44933 RepID=A0A1M7JJ55_9GAMM|nr:hypothetical protein SAMN05660971_03193 [Halomonas cupida]
MPQGQPAETGTPPKPAQTDKTQNTSHPGDPTDKINQATGNSPPGPDNARKSERNKPHEETETHTQTIPSDTKGDSPKTRRTKDTDRTEPSKATTTVKDEHRKPTLTQTNATYS